jgi:hypothetical protein
MTQPDCDNLDSFLTDDLSAEVASQFEAHLDHCERCRNTIDQQRWIDSLLCSRQSAALETPSTALRERFRQHASQHRRSTRLIACGLAAAAALVLAAGWTVTLRRQAIAPADISVNDAVLAHAPDSPLPATPRSTFVGGPDVLVMPVESPHPNVTVVRIYPIYQSTLAAHASVDSPTADESIWPNDLNGG